MALGPQKEALLRFGFEASLAGAGVAQQALEAVEPSKRSFRVSLERLKLAQLRQRHRLPQGSAWDCRSNPTM